MFSRSQLYLFAKLKGNVWAESILLLEYLAEEAYVNWVRRRYILTYICVALALTFKE